jgi:hypothetical protein
MQSLRFQFVQINSLALKTANLVSRLYILALEIKTRYFSYNQSQGDALFLKFTLIKNSTCFGQIYCPSSGVSQHCIHVLGICHASSVGVCWQTANRTSMTNTCCCVYSVEILLMIDSGNIRNIQSTL